VLRENGKERLYSIADPNWNVVAIIDSTGNVKERYTYDAFGKRNVFDVNFTAKTETSFDWTRAFTGQVLDGETGLMLYRNRFYSVDLGRFVSRDPIGYGDDINLFRYVNNSPVVGNDATGLFNQYDGQIRGCMQLPLPAREECLNNLLSLYSEFPNDPTIQAAIDKVNAAIKKTESKKKKDNSCYCTCLRKDCNGKTLDTNPIGRMSLASCMAFVSDGEVSLPPYGIVVQGYTHCYCK
jgi:RHS repeat-associated protein